jgi:hypothetical protein
MKMILVKGLGVFVPVCLVFGGWVNLSIRGKTAWSVLEVVGV